MSTSGDELINYSDSDISDSDVLMPPPNDDPARYFSWYRKNFLGAMKRQTDNQNGAKDGEDTAATDPGRSFLHPRRILQFIVHYQPLITQVAIGATTALIVFKYLSK